MLNEQGSDMFILEKEVGEGTTIGDLLAELASSYADFRKAVLNPDTGKLSDQIMIILNNSLLQGPDVTEDKLIDVDSVILIPMYTGG